MRKAQQSEVLIYSIGLLSEEEPREARQAKRALKALAEASGGLDYYPKDLAEVDRITPQVAHEIRSQYMISYLPTNTAFDGKFRKITVAVKGYRQSHGPNPQRLLCDPDRAAVQTHARQQHQIVRAAQTEPRSSEFV